jgi:predicted metal-binding membrane protein
MGMSVSMAAMMLPTAAPFFLAYGRDTRRPPELLITAAIYVAMWAAIGAVADFAMSGVMLPSSPIALAAVVVFAIAWTVSPWSRHARARCREMSGPAPRADGLRGAVLDGSAYAACCLTCSAGAMVVPIMLGMSNVWLLVAATAALFVYKLR